MLVYRFCIIWTQGQKDAKSSHTLLFMLFITLASFPVDRETQQSYAGKMLTCCEYWGKRMLQKAMAYHSLHKR